MIRLAVFASGAGSNAVNIAKYFKGHKHIDVAILVCNKADAPVINKMTALGIKSLLISNEQAANGEYLLELLNANSIDFIVLAGYLRKMPDSVIQKFPERILNIHPSLLPKYGGKGMYGGKVHKAVVDAKETKSGISIHFVNEVYDQGKIAFQAEVLLDENETPESLANKIHELEQKHFPQVIESCLSS